MITYPKANRTNKANRVKESLSSLESFKPVEFRLGELFCGPGGIALGALNSTVKQNGIVYSAHQNGATRAHQNRAIE
ncbi:MAG: hypothetical protein WCL49_04210, partial [bacterium]